MGGGGRGGRGKQEFGVWEGEVKERGRGRWGQFKHLNRLRFNKPPPTKGCDTSCNSGESSWDLCTFHLLNGTQ